MGSNKHLIICGTVGSGKTTLCKHISEDYNCDYISMYKLMENITEYDKQVKFNKINEWLYSLDNNKKMIIDCDCFIMPEDFNKLNNSNFNIIFLGFYSCDKDTIFDLMYENYKKKNIEISKEKLKEKIKNIKAISIKIHDDCIKYGYTFFDLNKDKKVYLEEIESFLIKNKYI